MSRLIQTAEFEYLLALTERSLTDSLYVQRWAEGAEDAFGHAAETWVEDTLPTNAGIQATSINEEGNQAEISVAGYRIRLPYDEDLDSRDRLRLVLIKGRTVNVLTAILGEPSQGNLHRIANVQEVVDV